VVNVVVVIASVVVRELEVTHYNQRPMANHMYPGPCSSADRQDILCNKLHRYCSERTNGSPSDVGRKRKKLGLGRGILELDRQGTDLA
jgi:hypothetical protein